MVMLRKIDPLYFLDIGSVYPRVEGLVVTFPLDKMLFNTAFIACAHYFIYVELGLWRYSDLDKLVIVKLPFDRSILQVWEFVNRLGHALNDLDYPKYFCWKGLFIPFGKLYLFLLSLQDLPL